MLLRHQHFCIANVATARVAVCADQRDVHLNCPLHRRATSAVVSFSRKSGCLKIQRWAAANRERRRHHERSRSRERRRTPAAEVPERRRHRSRSRRHAQTAQPRPRFGEPASSASNCKQCSMCMPNTYACSLVKCDYAPGCRPETYSHASYVPMLVSRDNRPR